MRNPELKLYPYQEQGAAFLTSRYHALLADEMGLGKTAQVIEALDRVNAQSVVIICPASVRIHWAREFAKWSNLNRRIGVLKDGKSQIPPHPCVIITSYNLLLNNRTLKRLGVSLIDAVVIDEAHYLKNTTAKRTKLILGKSSFLHKARYKWALTGTPVPNRPSEFYPLLYTMAPECIEPYLSWRAYGERYCAGFSNWQGFNAKGASNTEELRERVKTYMLRRELKDVEHQLPDKIESIIEMEVPGAAELTANEYLSTARRLLAEAKVPQASEHIKDIVADVGKVVVFAHHRNVIDALNSALSEANPRILYGGMSMESKQRSIDDFINDESVGVFIAQTGAGGTGVDGLQKVCHHIVFVELDWSPGVMDQAIGRLVRTGQKNGTVVVHYLAVADSLDTQMDQTLAKKRHVINKIVKSEGVFFMTLESTLERIAIALESIASAPARFVGTTDPEPAAKPAAKKAKEKPAVASEIDTANKEVAGNEAPVSGEPSLEELRKAAVAFLAVGGPEAREVNTLQATQLINKYAPKLDEVPGPMRAALIADFAKGPKSTTDLLGI